jgi:hypothetical protein
VLDLGRSFYYALVMCNMCKNIYQSLTVELMLPDNIVLFSQYY